MLLLCVCIGARYHGMIIIISIGRNQIRVEFVNCTPSKRETAARASSATIKKTQHNYF